MENQNRWILDDDVVIKLDAPVLKDLRICTAEDMRERVHKLLGQEPLPLEGASCRLLAPGNQWRKGKVRLVVEFFDEEPLA